MRKLLFAVLAMLCATTLARAQATTAVSAHAIQGLNGGLLVSGSLCFQATDQNDNNIGVQVSGGGTVVSTPFCTSVTNGVIVTFNVPNPAVSTPQNVRYRIYVTQGSRVIARFPLAYLCNQSGACGAPYTFNFDTCLSSTACIANPIPVTTVPGPTGPAGPTGATGATGTITSNSGGTAGGNWCILGQDPFRDVKCQTIQASGSLQNTTLSSSFTATSTTVHLTAAIDFANGEQIRIVGAGSTSSLTAPTGTAVTPCTDTQTASAPTCPGGTGSTTYQYQVIAVDVKFGTSAAASAVQITNGNASLSYTNFNEVTWSATTGAVYYCVYGRASGSMALQGCTPNLGWYDYGNASGLSTVVTETSTIPSTPPASAGIGFYYGTITSGGGTTTLTMDTAAGTTLASGTVEHDDSAALQGTWNASASGSGNNGDKLFMPCGSYNITQPILFSPASLNNPVGNEVYGESQDCVKLYQHVTKDIFLIINPNSRMFFHDFTCEMASQATGACIHFAGGVSGNAGNGTGTVRTERITSTGGGIALQSDNNIVQWHAEKVTLADDVNMRFGEPGNPVQLDGITCEYCDTYTGSKVVNWPGLFIFVGNGVGSIKFTRGLQEGILPSGYTGASYWMGGFSGDIQYDDVEFAPESIIASGAYWQAVPGLPACCGRITWLNELQGIPDGGSGVVDWSAGTNSGKGPYAVIWNSATNNGHVFFKNANDTANGVFCFNSQIAPVQTVFYLAGGGNQSWHNCRGLNEATGYFQFLGGISDQQSLTDLIDYRDQSTAPGLCIFCVTQNGAIHELERAAPSGVSAQDFMWPDSTAHQWLQNNNSGGSDYVGDVIEEYCGATSGSTQACAKTRELKPIIVFGEVTLNTATSQSITALPFTSSTSYACSGSDLTTVTGIVSFNTYAAASVTIAESGGVNTDHLRYSCAGF